MPTTARPPATAPLVPVTMGSPRFRTLETDLFTVTEAWFPPGAVLHPHTHARSIFATMVDGSFDTTIHRRRLDCSSGVIWTEPREERHANFVGTNGARALVVQPAAAHETVIAPFDRLTSEVFHVRHGGITAEARRLLAELDLIDDYTHLVADSIVLEMVVAASRLRESRHPHHAPPPRWLLRAQEILHSRSREGLRLAHVSASVGETPWRLAREFRRYFRTSVGAYARAVRLSWALDQLAATTSPISEIAHEAGYADQSHFTRACARAIGVGPAEYRRRASSARPRARSSD